MNKSKIIFLFCVVFILISALPIWPARSQNLTIPFDTTRWIFSDADTVQHDGRQCLIGTAYLRDVQCQNGIIEVDIWMEEERAYPGVIFRMTSENEFENIYIRPHRSKYYNDVFQYMPVMNGIECWQLYNGDGYTAGGIVPRKRWVHVRVEFNGKYAQMFWDSSDSPVLFIPDLKIGTTKGTIGLRSAKNKSAIFSNFIYRSNDDMVFPTVPYVDTLPGIITEWEISQTFASSVIQTDQYPTEETLRQIQWEKVKAELSGLVNVARFREKAGGEPQAIIARTLINAEKNEIKKLAFGYSDVVDIFCNGTLCFEGTSAYQQRDLSFLGIVGLFDAVSIPLNKGENELLLIITELSGGWGFMAQDAGAMFQAPGVEKVWQTNKDYKIPETVVYDNKRRCFYVSNYDGYNPSRGEGKQSVSKLDNDGKLIDLDWIKQLNNPVGMTILDDRLYIVERRAVVVVDITTGSIQKRLDVAGAVALNDIAADESGLMYVSDAFGNVIYRINDNKIDEWFRGGQIVRPNGLHLDGDELIVANNGDYCLKSINIKTKSVKTIARLAKGIIDGIEADGNGNYFVSQTDGRIFQISKSGSIRKILDMTALSVYTANFTYCSDRHLLVIPTFTENSVIAFRISDR